MNIIWRVGDPLRFVGWTAEGRSRERGGKKLRCSFTLSCCSTKLQSPHSSSFRENGRIRKLNRWFKFRFPQLKLISLHTSQPQYLPGCLAKEGGVVKCLIALVYTNITYTCWPWCRIKNTNLRSTHTGSLTYFFSAMNYLPAYSGARISGCWTLSSDGR